MKKALYKNCLRSHDTEDRKAYVRLNRELKRDISKHKNTVWEKKISELSRFMGGRVSEAWATIKNLRRDTKQGSTIHPISIGEWEQHYRALLQITGTISSGIKYMTAEKLMKIMLTKLLWKKVWTSLNDMKNGKAAGPGGISIELVKYGPSILLERMVRIMNKCMLEDIPQDWNLAYLNSIHKRGNKNICGNYRGISITNSIWRLYSRILKNRIQNTIDTVEEQSGFQADRSCLDK